MKSSCLSICASSLKDNEGRYFLHYFESMRNGKLTELQQNRVFSHDVTAAILLSQNNETAAMLVSQTSPVGVELLSYANAFFCSNKFA